MKFAEIAALIMLGAIWGASFLFIRIVVPVVGPFMMMFLRVILAGAILWVYAMILRDTPHLLHRWKEFLILGTISAAMPFTLIAFSQLTLNASLAAIINSLTPLFTAIFASIWGSETLTRQKIIGVMMGIFGVAVLVGGSTIEINTTVIIAVFASVGAALCYGIGAVFASNHFTGLPPLHLAIGLQFSAGVVLFVPASMNIPSATPSMIVVGAFLGLSLISTAFAYLLYFFLLNNIGPTRAMTVTFLVPAFGTLWGVLFLDETLTIGMLFGMVIILASVALVLVERYQKAA